MKTISKFLAPLLLIFLCSATHPVKKVFYPFTTDPIDVVIPCHTKDLFTLDLCINGIRTQCKQVRRIIVVSQKKLTDNAEWFDESLYPFSKDDIALAIFRGNKDAAANYISGGHRLGWIYQQLLKLYAPYAIPDISPNVLLLDADTIFLNSIEFINSEGVPYLTAANENHGPYFEHMKRLLPWLKRETQYSGISHHMLVQKCVLDDLFKMIEKRHRTAAWKALCSCITDPFGFGLSEYEIYFNFILARSNQAIVRSLVWDNSDSIDKIETHRQHGNSFVSYHAYMRRN
jgi:hypothetical protein